MSTEIIIISWNGRDDTLRAIESVHPQIGSGSGRVSDATIAVVDNGSTDHTSETVGRRFPTVRVVRLTENRGFTGGIAAGLADSAADRVIFLNNDAIVEPGWLQAFDRALSEAPDDIVAVSGRIVDLSGKRADFVGGVITFDGHGFQPGYHKPLDEVMEPESGDEILFACGGNMIVRREEFIELGGFDDDYFAYFEDIDFGWRARLSGRRITYSREAVARHRSAATSNRLGNFERGVLFEKNAAMTALKNLDEEVFQEMAASIFLTLLHREHRYLVDRTRHRGLLSRPPLGEPGTATRGWWDRIADRVRKSGIRLDDPLAIMQIRATEWVLNNMDRIMEKRAVVQSMRKVPDREIFGHFPMAIVPTYPGDEALFASSLFNMLEPVLPTERKILDELMEK